MKHFLVLLVSVPFITIGQHLDHIQTRKQAEEFIVRNLKYNNLKYDGFAIEPTDSSGVDIFKKGDFNHDGMKDLFVLGTARFTEFEHPHEADEMMIILGDEKKPRKVEFSYRYFSNESTGTTPYPKVIKKNGKDYIAIRYDIIGKHETVIGRTVDTIFVQDDRFMLFTMRPDKVEIDSISYRTSACPGKCPVFEFSIKKNGQVKYKGIDKVDKIGDFNLSADPKDWNYMKDLIHNGRVLELKNKYAISSEDDQTAWLTVHYKSGETKKIEDYGMVGTYGLSILFDFFLEMIRF